MPLRKLTQKEYKRRFKPDKILEKIELKNKTFKKYMQCKQTQLESKECLKIDYKTLKNEITTLSRQSKKDYYK